MTTALAPVAKKPSAELPDVPALDWQPHPWVLPAVANNRTLAPCLVLQSTGHVVLSFRPDSELPAEARERAIAETAARARQRLQEELAGVDPRGLERVEAELKEAPKAVALAEAAEAEAAARVHRLQLDPAASPGERAAAAKELARAQQGRERACAYLEDLRGDAARRRHALETTVGKAAARVVGEINTELAQLQEKLLARLADQLGKELSLLALLAAVQNDGHHLTLANRLTAEVLPAAAG